MNSLREPRFQLLGMASPNVRKIVLMLEELEADYDVQIVKVFRGEQFTAEFTALNPFSKTPVLISRTLRAGARRSIYARRPNARRKP
jgi:hypothetical protein